MHGGKFIHIAAAFYAAPVNRAYQAFCRQVDDKLAAFFDQMVAVPFRPHTDGNHAGHQPTVIRLGAPAGPQLTSTGGSGFKRVEPFHT